MVEASRAPEKQRTSPLSYPHRDTGSRRRRAAAAAPGPARSGALDRAGPVRPVVVGSALRDARENIHRTALVALWTVCVGGDYLAAIVPGEGEGGGGRVSSRVRGGNCG